MSALLLAVAASLCWGVGSVAQKHAMALAFPRIALAEVLRSLPRILGTLLRSPAWVIGFAAMIAGAALFGTALGRGDITVVQPVVCLTGVVAALVGVGFLGERLGRLEWAGIALTLLGVALVGLGGGGNTAALPAPMPLAIFVLATVLGALAVAAAGKAWLSTELTLSVAAGLVYGLTNLLGKLLTQRASLHAQAAFDLLDPHILAAVARDWPLWAILGANVVAGVFYQTAFANGRASVVAPIVTIVSNILPILGAVLLFGERPHILHALGLAVVLAGTALLALEAQRGGGGSG
ncbi:MAG: EamA family transporter [Pseudomonadota bacterium]